MMCVMDGFEVGLTYHGTTMSFTISPISCHCMAACLGTRCVPGCGMAMLREQQALLPLLAGAMMEIWQTLQQGSPVVAAGAMTTETEHVLECRGRGLWVVWLKHVLQLLLPQGCRRREAMRITTRILDRLCRAFAIIALCVVVLMFGTYVLTEVQRVAWGTELNGLLGHPFADVQALRSQHVGLSLIGSRAELALTATNFYPRTKIVPRATWLWLTSTLLLENGKLSFFLTNAGSVRRADRLHRYLCVGVG